MSSIEEPIDDEEEDRVMSLFAERALYGLDREDVAELSKLGVNADSDPRALELERALALVTLIGLNRSDDAMPVALRNSVQARAFRYFDEQPMQALLVPTTTTGANIVEVPAPLAKPRASGSRFLAWALAATFIVAMVGVYGFRRGLTDGSSPRAPAATGAYPDSTIRIESIPRAGVRVPSELHWVRGGRFGTADVNELQGSAPGARCQVWIQSSGRKKLVGSFICGAKVVDLRSPDAESDIQGWMITDESTSGRTLLEGWSDSSTPR